MRSPAMAPRFLDQMEVHCRDHGEELIVDLAHLYALWGVGIHDIYRT